MAETRTHRSSAVVRAVDNGTITIETSRLLLRGAEDADVDGLHDCFSDATAMKYWSSLPHETKADTLKWIAMMRKSNRNGITDFVIELKTKEPHTCIGKVGVWSGNEIGFIIARKYWKQGLANEAVTAVIDHLFAIGSVDAEVAARLNSIWDSPEQRPIDLTADVDPRNDLSLRALSNLGFEIYETKEKTFQIGGEWVDSVYLSLKKEDWQRRRNVPTS